MICAQLARCLCQSSSPATAAKSTLVGCRHPEKARRLITRRSRSAIPRLLGESFALLLIHDSQSEEPFDWLHLPQAGTKFAISVM